MNKDIAEGKWKEMKGKIREQYGKLSDDEIQEAKGSSEKLSGKLQSKYGFAKDEADKKANELFKH